MARYPGRHRTSPPSGSEARPAIRAPRVYSLGICFYELLTGKRPFRGSTAAEIMTAHLRQEPPPLDKTLPGLVVPKALVALIWRCLAKHPDLRPPDGAELHDALDEAASASSTLDEDSAPLTTSIVVPQTLPSESSHPTIQVDSADLISVPIGAKDDLPREVSDDELSSTTNTPPATRRAPLLIAVVAIACVAALLQLGIAGNGSGTDAPPAADGDTTKARVEGQRTPPAAAADASSSAAAPPVAKSVAKSVAPPVAKSVAKPVAPAADASGSAAGSAPGGVVPGPPGQEQEPTPEEIARERPPVETPPPTVRPPAPVIKTAPRPKPSSPPKKSTTRPRPKRPPKTDSKPSRIKKVLERYPPMRR